MDENIQKNVDKENKIHKYSVFFSDDYFVRETLLKTGGNMFAITKHYLFLSYQEAMADDHLKLMAADLVDSKLQLRSVELSFSMLKEHSYTIVESSNMRVFMHISHSTHPLEYGHVYVTDSRATRLDKSLEFNVRNVYGYCDFESIEGVPNFYIANHYDEESLKLARFQAQNAVRENIKGTDITDYLLIQSKITFDKGRMWQNIAPPKSKELC